MDQQSALLICNHISGLGTKLQTKLISYFGCAADIFKASKTELILALGGYERVAEEILKFESNKKWQEDLKEVEKQKVMLVTKQHPSYPKQLLTAPDAAHLLYIKGVLHQDRKTVAIVGTRECSIYGSEMAKTLGKELAEAGVIVVSGFARGIDTAAHLGALQPDGGSTYAVLGSGLSTIYPAENRALVGRVAQNGAVISQFPMFTTPEKYNFPKRNYTVSGMSDAVILVEAPLKSGAMITMELAEIQGKTCFALPGRADSVSFCGNHKLLKLQKARLVENAGDVLSLIGIKKINSFQNAQIPDLNGDESRLYSCFPCEEIGINELEEKSGLPAGKLNCLIMALVLKRLIREFPGRIYKKESGWQKT